MIINKEQILDYIPHRPPFVMIDNLLNADQEQFESVFLIESDNILVKNGFLLEGGLIENIAQTCAAGFGFLDRAEGGKPKIGYIGSVSRLELFDLPPVNALIRTVVTRTHHLGNIFMVTGRNYLADRILLECEMKIVII